MADPNRFRAGPKQAASRPTGVDRCHQPSSLVSRHRAQPGLRGYGSTRFLSDDTLRNGQQAAPALDTVALMDTLKIDRAIIAGFDCRARSPDIVAGLTGGPRRRPRRFCVSLGARSPPTPGWTVDSRTGEQNPSQR